MFFYHHVSVLCCQQLSAGPCFCRCCWPRLCCSIDQQELASVLCCWQRLCFSNSMGFFLCSVTSWRSLFRNTRFFSSSWHSFLSMGSSLFNLSKSDWAILQWMHSVECVYTLMYPSCTNLTNLNIHGCLHPLHFRWLVFELTCIYTDQCCLHCLINCSFCIALYILPTYLYWPVFVL